MYVCMYVCMYVYVCPITGVAPGNLGQALDEIKMRFEEEAVVIRADSFQ